MGNYMYCFPLAARHSIEALHCISEKRKIFVDCGWYIIVISFRSSLAGIAQMDVYWVVTSCTVLSFICFGRTSCLYLQGDNMCEICSLSYWPQYLHRSSHLSVIQSSWRLMVRVLTKRRNIFILHYVTARETIVWKGSTYDCPEKMRQLLLHTCLADGTK